MTPLPLISFMWFTFFLFFLSCFSSNIPTTTAHAAAMISPTSVQRFYGLVGPALDLLSIVEDKPRNRALDLALNNKNNNNEECCKSILEIGPGTGRTARQILTKGNKYCPPKLECYTGIELTPRMAKLATSKLDQVVADNNNNQKTIATRIIEGNCLDDSCDWSGGQQTTYDRIIAFYVLDIFTDDQIRIFLKKCQQYLSPNNGKLILVSLTDPTTDSSFLSKVVMGTWKRISNVAPILLGGCRPIQLSTLLLEKEENEDGKQQQQSTWQLEHCEQMSVLGYTSEIVIASLVTKR